jgi:hypothetical protein
LSDSATDLVGALEIIAPHDQYKFLMQFTISVGSSKVQTVFWYFKLYLKSEINIVDVILDLIN